MNPRTTGIVFLVAAALFAFIYFYEIGGEEGRREAEESESRLFPELEAEDIEAIAFTTSDGVRARVVRVDAGWELREPLAFPGDEFAVDAVASALADLKSESSFEDPQEPGVYGLGEGAAELRFEAGGEEYELRLGNKTPMGSNVYAAVGSDPVVHEVPGFTANAFKKSLTDLREKRLVRFDPSAVKRIEASWRGGGRAVLEASEEGWSLVEPIQDRADQDTVEALLSDLSFLRATGFEDEPPPDAEAGLDDPEWNVRLSGAAEAGGEPLGLELAIGDVDGDSRLARGASASLYRIPAERLADFPRELVAYRYKELARFPSTEASRVELVFERLASSEEGDEPLEIVAARGETGWDSAPERFKPGRVAQLVNELARLSGDDILFDPVPDAALAELGLSPPRARVRVYAEAEGGEPLAAVEIGALRGDDGIVARPEGGQAVYLLSPRLTDVIPTSLEAFRSEFRSEETPFAEGEEEEPTPDAEAPLEPDPEAPDAPEEG